MTTVTILDEVLETVLLVILATDPSITDWLIFASTYAMRAASKPAVKRTFAALLIFAFFLLAAISIPTDPALEFNSTTPYGLLGVTTTSSSKTITTAYDNLVHETKDSVLISTLATSKLEAYQAAHKTLTDPLQRCLYHRDNKVPDWYGVPKLCWGEMLVDKLQAAKGSIRASADAKAPLKETRAAMRKLRGLPDGAQETESKPAEKSKSAKSTPQSNPTESFWARMPKPTLTSVQQSLNGTKEAIITLPAKMKQYIRVMFRILQLSILVIFPAAVQRWLGRIKATLEFLPHKIMALLKMVSPRKPLTQLWNTVLTTLKDFLSWIKMLQFLINLPAKIRECFGWAKEALNHATQRTTKALKKASPGKFWIRPFNTLSTQTWQCLCWLGAMLTFIVSGRHYIARLGKTVNFKRWANYLTNSVPIKAGVMISAAVAVLNCFLGDIFRLELIAVPVAICTSLAILESALIRDTASRRRETEAAWHLALQAMAGLEGFSKGEEAMEGNSSGWVDPGSC